MFAMITVGLLLIAAGVVLPFFQGIDGQLYKWLYTAGAVLNIIGRLFTQYKGKSLRLKRLYRIEGWSAVFFCVAAFFLFYPPGNNLRDVLAFTLAGGAIQIYTSIMIPRAAQKESTHKEK